MVPPRHLQSWWGAGLLHISLHLVMVPPAGARAQSQCRRPSERVAHGALKVQGVFLKAQLLPHLQQAPTGEFCRVANEVSRFAN